MKSLYIIGPADGPYKVGIAADVGQRLAALQTGSPLPLRVLAHRPSPQGYDEERAVHARLSEYRLQGEWFDCALPVVCEAAGMPLAAQPEARGIGPEALAAWLDEMRSPPFRKGEEECRIMLGLSPEAWSTAKADGGGPMMALACRALLHRLEPYG